MLCNGEVTAMFDLSLKHHQRHGKAQKNSGSTNNNNTSSSSDSSSGHDESWKTCLNPIDGQTELCAANQNLHSFRKMSLIDSLDDQYEFVQQASRPTELELRTVHSSSLALKHDCSTAPCRLCINATKAARFTCSRFTRGLICMPDCC
eukprot:scaffold101588_cov29-Prasinocladus_malaysianus.AAC.1